MSLTDEKYYSPLNPQTHSVPFRESRAAINNPEFFADVYVNPITILQIVNHSLTTAFLKPPLEIMGIAVGHFDENEHAYYITNSILIPYVGKGASVDPPPAIQGIAVYRSQLLQKLGRNDEFISFYHSHPNLHVYYSKKDVDTHRRFWRALYGTCVGFVVDPNNTLVSNYLNFSAFSVTDEQAAKQKPEPTGKVFKKYGSAANYYYELNIHYYNSKSDKIVIDQILNNTYSTAIKLSTMAEQAKFLNQRDKKLEDVTEYEDNDPVEVEDLIPLITKNYKLGLNMRKMIKNIFN